MADPFLFRWRSRVVSSDGPPSSTTRHVLLTLSLHMDPSGGSCHPSTRLLAEETGLTRKTVETHLQTAEEQGWIRRGERAGEGRGWKRHEYEARTPPRGERVTPPQPDEGGEGGTPPHPADVAKEVRHEAAEVEKEVPHDEARGGVNDAVGWSNSRPEVANDVLLRSSMSTPERSPTGTTTASRSSASPDSADPARDQQREAGEEKGGEPRSPRPGRHSRDQPWTDDELAVARALIRRHLHQGQEEVQVGKHTVGMPLEVRRWKDAVRSGLVSAAELNGAIPLVRQVSANPPDGPITMQWILGPEQGDVLQQAVAKWANSDPIQDPDVDQLVKETAGNVSGLE